MLINKFCGSFLTYCIFWWCWTMQNVWGVEPTQHTISMLWASVIASKEIGKILGTLLLPYMAEKLGRRGGLLLNNWIVFIGCITCLLSAHAPFQVIMIGRVLLGMRFRKQPLVTSFSSTKFWMLKNGGIVSLFVGISMICGVGLASLFLIEVASLKTRGSSGALIQVKSSLLSLFKFLFLAEV